MEIARVFPATLDELGDAAPRQAKVKYASDAYLSGVAITPCAAGRNVLASAAFQPWAMPKAQGAACAHQLASLATGWGAPKACRMPDISCLAWKAKPLQRDFAPRDPVRRRKGRRRCGVSRPTAAGLALPDST